jgi:hypothetical protein
LAEALVDLGAFGEILFPIFRPGARKIDNNQTNHSADPGLIGHFSGLIGKEIHIIETGGAAAQHLRNSMLHTVTHKRGGYPSLLGRPDVMVEPVHKRKIIRQPAKQGHSRMGMGID